MLHCWFDAKSTAANKLISPLQGTMLQANTAHLDHQLSDSPWLYSPSDAHNIQPHHGTPISPENISDVFEIPQSRKSTQNLSSHQSRHTTTPNMPVWSPSFGPHSAWKSIHSTKSGPARNCKGCKANDIVPFFNEEGMRKWCVFCK